MKSTIDNAPNRFLGALKPYNHIGVLVSYLRGIKITDKTIMSHDVTLSPRAERRAGEMLREMDREKPGEYKKLHDETFFSKPSLEDLGISKIQSHRWQLEARRQARMSHGNRESRQNSDGTTDTKKYLADTQQEAISLRYDYGLSIRDIAGHLNLKKSIIYCWVSNNSHATLSNNNTPRLLEGAAGKSICHGVTYGPCNEFVARKWLNCMHNFVHTDKQPSMAANGNLVNSNSPQCGKLESLKKLANASKSKDLEVMPEISLHNFNSAYQKQNIKQSEAGKQLLPILAKATIDTQSEAGKQLLQISVKATIDTRKELSPRAEQIIVDQSQACIVTQNYRVGNNSHSQVGNNTKNCGAKTSLYCGASLQVDPQFTQGFDPQ